MESIVTLFRSIFTIETFGIGLLGIIGILIAIPVACVVAWHAFTFLLAIISDVAGLIWAVILIGGLLLLASVF